MVHELAQNVDRCSVVGVPLCVRVAECVGMYVGAVERDWVTVGADLVTVQGLQATCPLADRSTEAVATQMSLSDRRTWEEVLLR